MVVVGSPATTIFINNCNKLITIIRIEAERPMSIKNYNSQTDSKVKTCEECIDKETLDSISCWIVSFYLFLAAIPVSAVFIFNAFNKINNSITCKVDCFVCQFICSRVNYIKINFNVDICVFVLGYMIISFLYICFIYLYLLHYLNRKKIICKEIYDDLNLNCISMACSAASSVICLSISACFYSNCVTKVTVYLALLSVACFIGLRAKSCNNEYALTKIDIDCMNTLNKYSKTNGCGEEGELLVIKMPCLKYYKVMETSYLMMSAFFVFVTSVLGKFY